MKILAWIVISISLTPFINILETYFFADWHFLQFMAVMIAGDTILGFLVAFRKNQISSKGFAKFFWKIIAYMSVLILTHVLTSYQVHGNSNIFFLWFDDMSYAAIMVRESISIMENIGFIYPQAVPKWLLKRLKEFDLTGKFQKTE